MNNTKRVDNTLVFLIVISLLAAMALGAILHGVYDKRVVKAPLTLAEQQIQDYKKAEALCGKDNVREFHKCSKEMGCKSGSELDDPIYVCDDLEFASQDEASKSADYAKRLQSRVKSYCKYLDEETGTPIPFSL